MSLCCEGLNEEADGLLPQAREARNRTLETDAKIAVIGDGLEDVAKIITETRDNNLEATVALDVAESKCMIAFGPMIVYLCVFLLQLEAFPCF